MNNEFVVGLDVSTSCTGVSILSLDGKVINVSYHKPKGDTLVEKTIDFKHFVCNFLNVNGFGKPRHIYVEQNLQKFRRGFSSAHVINKLARFNGMVSYVMFENFGVQPEYINVNEGRKALGIKIPRGSNAKEVVFKWCKHSYADLEWPTKKLKSGPRKGLVILDTCCYDMADAIVTAAAGITLDERNK